MEHAINAHAKVRESRFDRVFDAVNAVIMALIVIIMLYPLYYTVIVSFSERV